MPPQRLRGTAYLRGLLIGGGTAGGVDDGAGRVRGGAGDVVEGEAGAELLEGGAEEAEGEGRLDPGRVRVPRELEPGIAEGMARGSFGSFGTEAIRIAQ